MEEHIRFVGNITDRIHYLIDNFSLVLNCLGSGLTIGGLKSAPWVTALVGK